MSHQPSRSRITLLRAICLLAICGIFAVFAGCADVTSGPSSLTQENVNTLQKGVTTRDQLIAQFGQPANTALAGDGGQVLSFVYVVSHAQASPLAVFGFSDSSATSRVRKLDAVIDKNNIVKDYAFSDQTQDTKVTGFMSANVVTTQVATKPDSK